MSQTHVDGMIAAHQPIRVLDHGYVKLVDSMGTDETVIGAARMSTGKGFISWDPYVRCKTCNAHWWMTKDRMGLLPGQICQKCCDNVPMADKEEFPRGDLGLLEYLYKNFHMSPFEQCELSIEMQAPIFVFREIHRHRTGSYNEFSARYAQMPNLHYLPGLERFQKQSTANKQGSAESFDEQAARWLRNDLEQGQRMIYQTYEDHLHDGLAKEVARLNTPVSRYSKMRMKMSMRNWFQFLNLRLRPNTQYETRMFAEACASIVKQLWPRSYVLFEEYDLNGVRLSATEAEIVKKYIESCGDDDSAVFHPQYEAVLKKFGAVVLG